MSGKSEFSTLGDALETTFIQRAEHFEELGSTNDRALEIAASLPEASVPYLILTDQQTAGRGRGKNQWYATSGVLTFSVILEPQAWRIPKAHWPRLSVAVGGAVTEALRPWLPQDRPRLKWPNDVYIAGRKVCGILIEAPADSSERLVIGIGINVENSFAEAPREVMARATSVRDQSGSEAPGRLSVLHAVLNQLDADLKVLGEDGAGLLTRWRSHCELTGRVIAISEVERVVTGTCLGLEDDASLVIRTAAGTQRCYAGTVTIVD